MKNNLLKLTQKNYRKSKFGGGFTMIEILVVISIIGILVAMSVFGLTGARESSRDARRRSDLQEVRAALEIYKSDCGEYPTSLPSAGSSLNGTNTEANSSCSTANSYISTIPGDPSADKTYFYFSDGITYELCSSLENGGTDTCSGSCGQTCNYKTVNP